MKKSIVLKRILIIFGILFIPLLFFGNAYLFPLRSFIRLWDVGHILVFGLWTYLALKYINRVNRYSFSIILRGVLILSLSLSFIIEYLQSFSPHRNFDIHDVEKNLLGATSAFFFFSEARKKISRNWLLFIKGILILLIVSSIMPFLKALTDESIARFQFPILSSFETPFEVERWSGNATISPSKEIVYEGRGSMKIVFTPESFSTAFLKFFPRDWNNYENLQLNLFYTGSSPITLVIRINDMDHINNGQEYYDRFNRTIDLKNGWQTVSIPLHQVKKAPRKREMDFKRIEAFGIFMVTPKTDYTVYLDNLKLVNRVKK